MRLHLNENTAGCSPRVLETLRALDRGHAGCYPDYDAATQAVADLFEVPRDYLLLTNGLDEGILAASAAALRDRSGGIPAALGVTPAFDMYETLVTALGGRMVTVPMGPDFSLPLEALLAASSPATRIAFVTNPHNPSGVVVPGGTLLNLARRLAPAVLFVDEAYADFGGDSLLTRQTLDSVPNLVIGRTFSKAYGLAGLRAGALAAAPDTLAAMRRIVPPYSLNAWAAAALPAAVADRAYRDWYVRESERSRELLGAACRRLGLTTWPSAGNFLLVRIGAAAPTVVAGMAARGIRVRDRSGEAGCEGCIRLTAGLFDDTVRAVAALEEVLCASA